MREAAWIALSESEGFGPVTSITSNLLFHHEHGFACSGQQGVKI